MSKKICCCRNCIHCNRFESFLLESLDTAFFYECELSGERITIDELDSSNICPHFKLKDGEVKFYIRNELDKQYYMSKIKRVIFNNPATIVFWNDGTKTVVVCKDEDTFDKEKGLAMAISKYFFNNKGYYNDIFRKWCKDESDDTQEYSFTVSSSNTGLELFSKYARQKLAGEITFEIGSKKEKRK